MGRKIPGKKHRGIKDPEKQREERFNRIKDKINAPPLNPNEQEIPESLQRIIKYKEKSKLAEDKNKKKSKVKKPVKRLKNDGRRTKQNNVLPGVQRYEGETDRSYLYRVTQAVSTIIKETQFENKYNVEIKRNKDTGEVEDIVKRPKDEIDEIMKQARMNKDRKKKKKKSNEQKLTKTQKREQKLKLKKENKLLMNMEEFDKYKDNVKFGEVVHAPPSLVTPKKVAKSNNAPRPGKKDLLLKSVLSSNKPTPTVQFATPRKTVLTKKSQTVEIDKKSKRKVLPVALRRQLEKQQTEAINAYRILKTKRNNLTL